MASLDNVEPKAEKKGDMRGIDPDAKLVSMMGMAMLDKGGLQTIEQALNTSQDPVQVVAQFVAQMAGRLAEYTAKEMGIDPAVYAKPNGFLDQILNYIEKKLGLPEEFSDQVYGETLEVMKAAAASPQQAGPAQAGPPGAPPGPAGGPPPGLDQGVM
jgi:hypothetical protein